MKFQDLINAHRSYLEVMKSSALSIQRLFTAVITLYWKLKMPTQSIYLFIYLLLFYDIIAYTQ